MHGMAGRPSLRHMRRAGLGLLVVFAAACSTSKPDPVIDIPPRAEMARLAPVAADSAFGRALQSAVMTHPALTTADAGISRAAADVSGERSLARPQISIGLDMGMGLLGGGSLRTIPVLQATQLIFDRGATRARVRAAEANLQSQVVNRDEVAGQVAFEAIEVALELQLNQRMLALADENLAIHDDFLEQTRSRIDAGAGVELDILTVQTRLADARAKRARARAELDVAQAVYREIFGPEAQPRDVPRAPALPDIGASTLVETSPRMRALVAERERAVQVLESVRAGSWPNLTLELDAGYDPATGQTPINAAVQPRVVLTGAQQRAAVAASEAGVIEIDASITDLERQILRSLAVLRSDQAAGQERLQAARAALEAHRTSISVIEEQFTIGRSTISELLDAQRDFLSAQELVLVTELELLLSGYAALALSGDILDVFGIDPRARSQENGR